MSHVYVPWLEGAILVPLLAAVWVRLLRNPDMAWWHSMIACGLTLGCSVGSWAQFAARDGVEADRATLAARLVGDGVLEVDTLSAPLLPLSALLYALTVLATLRTKVRRFPFAWLLVSEAILLATLSAKEPWIIIALLAAGIVPPWVELRSRSKPTRVFLVHMILFVALLVVGQGLATIGGPSMTVVGVALLMAAVLVRTGIVPAHCWMTDLFEHASFGTALLFVTPMVGAYAAARLVLPIAPDWALRAILVLSLATALYAAGMALVQHEARRFFCYVFLSNSSLVFVGLEMATPLGLTGALCVWFSVGLSLVGFGLTLRSVEARTGRLSLDEFHGLFEHIPKLSVLFLLTSLASIGFPGTVGFVGAEMLVDGAIQVHPLVGIAIVIASALNGLAVLQAYFRVFTGTRHGGSIDLHSRISERIAVLVLTALIIGGGLYPQPGVASRYRAATELLSERQVRLGGGTATQHAGSQPAAHHSPAG
ncbi:MAG: oxidoreductase [Planctomycetia bacterium]|nr:oxidoreductase [Planctomycetia bacterium]